jgi:hypothetical protein
LLVILSEPALEIDEEVCACVMDWQKAFDCVKWNELMQIRMATVSTGEKDIDQKIVYMGQNVKVRLCQGETRSMKTGRGDRDG